MDLISILILLFLGAVIIEINPTRLLKAVFCIIPFYIALMTTIEGITFNTTTFIAANTQMAYMILVFVSLGSIVTIYSLTTKEDTKGA